MRLRIISVLLIITSYISYFFLIPPLTTNDEPEHISLLVGAAQGIYPHIPPKGELSQNLGMVKKIERSLNYADQPDRLPLFDGIATLREEVGDYSVVGIASYQAYIPPIYYLVGGVFYYLSKVTPYLLGQYYLLRLTSTLFYAGCVFLSWKIARRLIKDERVVVSLVLFFAINPLVLKMGIGINADIAVTFFSMAFLFLLLSIRVAKIVVNEVLLLAIVAALATLSKFSGIFTSAVFVLYSLMHVGVRQKSLRTVTLFLGVFFLLLLPWLVFVYVQYNTLLPEAFTTMCSTVGNGPLLEKIFYSLAEFRHTVMHYAGFMGHAWPHPFKWFFAGYVVLFVFLSTIGFIHAVFDKKHQGRLLILFTASLIGLLAILSLQHRFTLIDCDIQGRYMLPIFFALIVFLHSGLSRLVKNEYLAAYILRYFAIFHYLFILFTVLLLRYYV